jgi:hypothetical protein
MALWYECGRGFVKTSFARADLLLDAYLCCPGPSLANVDGELLRQAGIMTFALNTAYPKIRPDVWIGMDRPHCYDPRVWWEPFLKIARLLDENGVDTTISGGQHVRYFGNVFFADLEDAEAAEIFQRRAHDVRFVWVKNSFFFALHFMIWMGARRIRLVGCDFGGGRDYHDDRQLRPEQRESNRRLYAQQIEMLRRLMPSFQANGIELVSCTRDSPINEFVPYRPLADAVAESARRVSQPVSAPLHAQDAEFCVWKPSPREEAGVVVGCAPTQEWLLDWWWERYRAHNRYPVAFADFGVSAEARARLHSRGHVIAMDDVPANGWFRKPFALLRAPFRKILWLDLDVEVRGPLDPLFSLAGGAPGMPLARGGAMTPGVRWTQTMPAGAPLYCTSVVSVRHGDPLVEAWAAAVLDRSLEYTGDHEAMSHVIARRGASVQVFPEDPAVTVHWGGWMAKQNLQAEIENQAALPRWRSAGLIESCGVLVGCDAAQEWLLEFWWDHFSRRNSYPVAFADFGMSAAAREFCGDRGIVLDVPGDYCGRNPLAATFHKPFALLRSPFRTTVMMDLDCEVRGPLDPLFELAMQGCALSRDPHAIDTANPDPVQSGVVACTHGHPIVPAWAGAVRQGWRAMHSDQAALNDVIDGYRDRVAIMPREYHWLRLDHDNPAALIMHWTGPAGKQIVREKLQKAAPVVINPKTA